MSKNKKIMSKQSLDYELNSTDQTDKKNDTIDSTMRKRLDKPLKIFGGFCITVFIVMMIFSTTNTVDTSEAAKKALIDKVSTSLPVGAILLSNDEDGY